MSTLKELIGKSFVGKLFPEIDWRELDTNGYDEIYNRLQHGEQDSFATLDYLQKNKVKLGFHIQDNSGGGWTLLRNITLAPDAIIGAPYTLSLVMHEVFHLKQTIHARLSVYGELLAWQYQREAYRETFGREMGDVGEAFSGKKGLWDELAKLSPDSRDDLIKAQQLMREISTGYRSDCLPVYPLIKEVWYFLRQGRIRNVFETIQNLITCR